MKALVFSDRQSSVLLIGVKITVTALFALFFHLAAFKLSDW